MGCGSPGCPGVEICHGKQAARASGADNSSCGSPGCPGRAECHWRDHQSKDDVVLEKRITQGKTRPKDSAPRPGTKKRPIPGDSTGHEPIPGRKIGDAFSKVLLEVKSNLVLVAILYQDVVKFGGIKLLVFTRETYANFSKDEIIRIDPHFFPDDKSPIARLIPNELGLQLARRLLNLKDFELIPFRALLTVSNRDS